MIMGEKIREGQIQILSVLLTQIQDMRNKKLNSIEGYKYNIDILEKQLSDIDTISSMIYKTINIKKDPDMVEQLDKLEKQILKVSQK